MKPRRIFSALLLSLGLVLLTFAATRRLSSPPECPRLDER